MASRLGQARPWLQGRKAGQAADRARDEQGARRRGRGVRSRGSCHAHRAARSRAISPEGGRVNPPSPGMRAVVSEEQQVGFRAKFESDLPQRQQRIENSALRMAAVLGKASRVRPRLHCRRREEIVHNWRQFIHRRHQAQVSVVEDMQPRIGDEPCDDPRVHRRHDRIIGARHHQCRLPDL